MSKTDQSYPSKILTVVEAIHNGLTKNFTYYPADKLEQSTESWTGPYQKPVIKNHNTWTEPTGRVVKAEFKKSTIDPERFTIQLHMEVTDPDTVAKVMDGRYQTLSIGGSTDSCTCNICGKDIIKEGFCGHWKGRTYEGKQAHWTVGQMEFDEISWVNVPADANAQVIVKDATQRTTKPKESAEGRTTVVEGVLDQIDNLTEGQNPEVTPEGQTQTEGTTPEGTPEGTQQTESTKTVEELQAEITALTQRAEAAETRVTELEGEVNALTESKKALEEENQKQFKQNVALATSAKKILAESVVDMRIMLGKEKAEDRDNLVTEYAKSTAKVLGTQAEELRKEKPATVRESVQVQNPGLAAVNDPHAQTEGDTHTESTSGSAEVTGLKQMEEAMLAFFNR